jgi:hypothetical protein
VLLVDWLVHVIKMMGEGHGENKANKAKLYIMLKNYHIDILDIDIYFLFFYLYLYVIIL